MWEHKGSKHFQFILVSNRLPSIRNHSMLSPSYARQGNSVIPCPVRIMRGWESNPHITSYRHKRVSTADLISLHSLSAFGPRFPLVQSAVGTQKGFSLPIHLCAVRRSTLKLYGCNTWVEQVKVLVPDRSVLTPRFSNWTMDWVMTPNAWLSHAASVTSYPIIVIIV